MAVTKEALSFAFQKIKDFHAVQAGGSTDDLAESINLVLASVGFDHELLFDFAEGFEEISGEEATGNALLGLLIGLFVGNHDNWT